MQIGRVNECHTLDYFGIRGHSQSEDVGLVFLEIPVKNYIVGMPNFEPEHCVATQTPYLYYT